MLTVQVHPANIADRVGARAMLTAVHAAHPGITQVWADAAYTGPLIDWAKQELDLTLTITKRPRRWVRVAPEVGPPPMPTGMPIHPRRWVIERTFAWLGRSRRLSRDYEGLAETDVGWIYLAMVRLMIARLAKCPFSNTL